MSDKTPVPLPRYVPTIIFCCRDCGSDLQDEGFSYYCPGCRRTLTFAEVAAIDETDYDRD